MNDCKLCKNQSNSSTEVLFETEHWIFRRSDTGIKGHYFLELRTHRSSIMEIKDSEWYDYSIVYPKAIRWIQDHDHPVKIYTLCISEAVIHPHYHLIARFENDEKGLPKISNTINTIPKDFK
jgi:diadenosine tetraphosphate (Ap4A) HIT family hydrolase